ncbi:thioesterase [Clostridium felsineum]|uniref:thioesterase II family protein n=1 Tax=Clostridium felsineum TaxID=36839 RepID=UPI00214DA560|nr:thioesterase domain-containing protein [Clostridium felsineum]MCR3758483.1 thioesterase [Clostridium felsineum]
MKKIKLFCIPCAGGSANAYLKWNNYLHYDIELCPIELRGRGIRSNESYYNDIGEAVNDVFNVIKDLIDNSNEYALFGHSMGGLIAYELYYKLLEKGIKAPKHVFIYGKEPPDIKYTGINYTELDYFQFKESVLKMGGIPENIISDKEVYDFFYPIIRSDFKIFGEYVYHKKQELMDCDITIINGRDDKVSLCENLCNYNNYTRKHCKICIIEGDHFTLYKSPLTTVRIINSSLIL